MNFRKFLTLVAVAFTSVLLAQTTVPAIIDSSQVWTNAGSPYYINQNTLIDSNSSVVVLPGVEIIGSGSNTKLLIDGEFRVMGSVDSMVGISGLIITYNKESRGYNPNNGTGAYMQYADVVGTGVANRAIDLQNTDFKIVDSKVTNAYYTIYCYNQGYAKSKLEIDGCELQGVQAASSSGIHQGTVLTIYGDSTTTTIKYSEISYARYLQTAGKVTMENCNVHHLDQVQFYQKVDMDIRCNVFENLMQGVLLKVYGRDSSAVFNFVGNTLDSLRPSPRGMALFKMEYITSSYVIPVLNISQNNFLTADNKITLYGSNSNPSSSTSIDFTNNYWGGISSAALDSAITDYNDDILIFGTVDYSSMLSSPVLSCPTVNVPTDTSCQASYYIGVDTNNAFNMYIVNNSVNTTSNTTYTWSFGDGTYGTGSNPTHYYDTFGYYNLCLKIEDSLTGCYSVYCDTIGMDSLGNYYKREGFSITVLNESNLLSIENPVLVEDVRIYPNPSAGTLNLQAIANSSELMRVSLNSLMGQEVYMSEVRPIEGSYSRSLDLTQLSNGVYVLKIQIGSEIVFKRISIQR